MIVTGINSTIKVPNRVLRVESRIIGTFKVDGTIEIVDPGKVVGGDIAVLQLVEWPDEARLRSDKNPLIRFYYSGADGVHNVGMYENLNSGSSDNEPLIPVEKVTS